MSEEQQQQDEVSSTQEIATFDDWLASQDASSQSLVNGHISGLKSALEAERSGRKKLEKELRATAKQLEAGSEMQQRLEQQADALAATSRRAAFYEEAHRKGVTNLSLAYLAAKESGLLTDDGGVNIKTLKEQHPELFASTLPPPTNAGEGTQSGSPSTGDGNMDNFIRRRAGRHH